MWIVFASVIACDQGPDDVDRAAEDLDFEAEAEEEEEDGDVLEADLVIGPSRSEPPATMPSDGSHPGEPSSESLSLQADLDPDAMKPRWDCGGDPEGGTYVCCTTVGMYDLPYCCWWNGGGYDCG